MIVLSFLRAGRTYNACFDREDEAERYEEWLERVFGLEARRSDSEDGIPGVRDSCGVVKI